MQLSMGTIVERKVKPIVGIRITDRDSQVLLFLIQMKFAGLEEIHQKFFSKLQTGDESKSLKYAYERIAMLKQLGFVTATKHPRKWTNIILPTWKAYYFVRDSHLVEELPKPTGSYDLNTFDHDETVMKLRLEFESKNKITSWISDRTLRCFKESAGGLTGNYVPDGIYTNPDGEKVAFELEISVKGKDKYKDKIRKYVYLLTSLNLPRFEMENKPFPKTQPSVPFSKVHFVYAKELVRKHLENETRLYPELFFVEPLSNYLMKSGSK